MCFDVINHKNVSIFCCCNYNKLQQIKARKNRVCAFYVQSTIFMQSASKNKGFQTDFPPLLVSLSLIRKIWGVRWTVCRWKMTWFATQMFVCACVFFRHQRSVTSESMVHFDREHIEKKGSAQNEWGENNLSRVQELRFVTSCCLAHAPTRCNSYYIVMRGHSPCWLFWMKNSTFVNETNPISIRFEILRCAWAHSLCFLACLLYEMQFVYVYFERERASQLQIFGHFQTAKNQKAISIKIIDHISQTYLSSQSGRLALGRQSLMLLQRKIAKQNDMRN